MSKSKEDLSYIEHTKQVHRKTLYRTRNRQLKAWTH
jgi:hypothetical protein